jgi:amino acid adenylation domain-containing protein
MWLIQSLEPTNTAYNMGAVLRLRGDLDIDALCYSFDELLLRHETLRSRIRFSHDRPCQIIEPWRAGALSVVDLRERPDAWAEALARAESDLRSVFELDKQPWIRGRLFRTADDVFLLAIVLHHIAGDQWSMGVLGRELATLYNHRRAGTPVQLEPLPLSYRDFAHWQRSEAVARRFDQQLRFWATRLAHLPTVDLPVDRARPKVWTMNGAVYERTIPPVLYDAIEKLTRSAGSTPFMALLAGFAALLHRLSGQVDLPIGVPVANRSHSVLEKLVGTFVNTLVLRTDLQGEPDFEQLLGRVRATALEAFANQDVSFDRLVQDVGPRSDRSRPPLVQVLFNITNAPMQDIELDGLQWEGVVLDRGGAQFELSFTVDTELTRKLAIEYNTDLFEPATIERMAGQYLTLLAAAAAEPRKPIGRLAWLPSEQRVWLHSRNVTEASLPPAATCISLIEARAARSAAEIALSFAGTSVTYVELNAQANRLAQALRSAGARRDTRVAICVERSPLLVISLLAAQKSGAAYVPLDPLFPRERLEYMLTDSGAQVLLTSGLPPGLEVPEGVTVIDVAEGLRTGGFERNLPHGPRPSDAAYVLYTSGSTGRPKGVTVSHGALANFLCSMQQRPGLIASDVLAAVTTVSFDIAGLELYLPLIVGAHIELVPRETAADGAALANLLDRAGITVLQATPATWRMLVEAGWPGGKPFRALCGGEALSRKLADEILERADELWNLYGPTETTIWSTLDRIEPGGGPISIGRPIANTQVYVVDSQGELTPIGVDGEIYIGGAGVADGYHGRAALTAERFVADGHGDTPGRRLYRTGDRGRWGADGKLYHLGRSDHQVKIRGFRIELAEIETALLAHEAIRHAVAAVREARADDSRLVAYLTYHDGHEATSGDLKRFLRTKLPDYMVPSIFVPLVAMPLTPNGKIDRAALPNPFTAPRRDASTREPPATRTERLLAQIWRSLLKLERIDALDNFFELGGYSLLSLRVANMVERRTGYRMDPRSLFFHSLREVAGMIDTHVVGTPRHKPSR